MPQKRIPLDEPFTGLNGYLQWDADIELPISTANFYEVFRYLNNKKPSHGFSIFNFLKEELHFKLS